MGKIRIASIDDAEAILKIYSPFILNSGITQEIAVPSLHEFGNRIQSTLKDFPWLVYVADGNIAGYAYASRYRQRSGYRWCVETSVYLDKDFYGKKIGSALYSVLLQILKLQGYVNAYAVITLPNDISVKFHEQFGFKHFATYNQVGYKLGKWHDVGWWQYTITEHLENPAEPIPFSSLNATDVKRMLNA